MASNKPILRRIGWEAAREFLAGWIWSYWPIYGAPIVTAALAWLGGYSPTLIFLFCLAAFALIGLGLNQISQWQFRRSPEGKLDFGQPAIGLTPNDEKDQFPAITKMKLGMTVVNKAEFPLDVAVEALETQISDRVPTEKFFKRTFPLGTGATGIFTNGPIDLSKDITKNCKLLGHIKAKVRYGKPGDLKYEIEKSIYAAFKFDEDGNLAAAEPSITELKIG